jgi:electron transport complex protein RnfD
MDLKLSVSPSPHVRDGVDIKRVMYTVIIALIPATAGAVYFFGIRALVIIVLAAVSAVLTEAACQKAMKRKVTIADGRALLTGVLLAFNVPPGVPYWLPVVGSAFAIGIAKIPFGGLGYNPLNPALAGRAFLMASWPVYMTATWLAPSRGSLSGISAITTATPLGVYRYARGLLVDPGSGVEEISRATSYLGELYSGSSLKNLFFGNVGGCVGETSALLLLAGAAYLMIRRIITWRIPVSYIATVAFLAHGWKGSIPGQPPLPDTCRRAHSRRLLHGHRHGNITGDAQRAADFWIWLRLAYKYNKDQGWIPRGSVLFDIDHEYHRALDRQIYPAEEAG